jgi:hypothetical protein
MSLDSLFKMRLGFCFTLDLIRFLSWLMIASLVVSDCCWAVRCFVPYCNVRQPFMENSHLLFTCACISNNENDSCLLIHSVTFQLRTLLPFTTYFVQAVLRNGERNET